MIVNPVFNINKSGIRGNNCYNFTHARILIGVTTEYPSTIVLDLTAHLFLKNDERMRRNKLPTVAGYSVVKLFND